MDAKRAQTIMESLGVIDVYYQDSPVWIEQIHEPDGKAEVKDLESGKRMEVELARLIENEESWME